jgi:hypothetical protein
MERELLHSLMLAMVLSLKVSSIFIQVLLVEDNYKPQALLLNLLLMKRLLLH